MKRGPLKAIFDPPIQYGEPVATVQVGTVPLDKFLRGTKGSVVVVGVAGTTTLDYPGICSLLSWTVPAGISSVRFECWGAAGLGNSAGTGLGGYVAATFAVTAGQTYNLYVGCAGGSPTAGWPNGGAGGTGNNMGQGGGGATYVILSTDDLGVGITTNAKIVAGGGGGASDNFYNVGRGGHGGYPNGGNPTTGPATGATSTAGGTGYEAGDTDGQGFGGDGQNSGATLVAECGGGGGGWHGGGSSPNDGGGGGGGSGYVAAGGSSISSSDGVRAGNGLIRLSF